MIARVTNDECPKCGNPNYKGLNCPDWSTCYFRAGKINYLPAKPPYVLSDSFLIRATFVMVCFVFSIMLIFFLAGLFGGT